MKVLWAVTVALLMSLVSVGSPAAKDLKDKVKLELDTTVMESGMEPGMYVCSSGHLHIKATVQNQADVPLGQVKIAGKAL